MLKDKEGVKADLVHLEGAFSLNFVKYETSLLFLLSWKTKDIIY